MEEIMTTIMRTTKANHHTLLRFEKYWKILIICKKMTIPDFETINSFPILMKSTSITFFTGGPADPSLQWKRASNSIQDPCHVGYFSSLNWSFVGRSSFHLLWPILYREKTLRSLLKPLLKPLVTFTIERNNYMGSLLKPLLKKVTPLMGWRMLCLKKVFPVNLVNLEI
jgi:hypothetical protein